MKGIRRSGLVVAALAGLASVLGAASPAAAHAAYRASDPADESTVSAPPSQVWAEFTEPPTQDSHLEVFDPCGRQVDHGDSAVTGYRITVSMSGAAAGTYRVRFAVISTLDGHPTVGDFTFTSSSGEPCPGEEEPPAEEPAGPSQSRERPERSRAGGGGRAARSNSSEPAAERVDADRARPERRSRGRADDGARARRDQAARRGGRDVRRLQVAQARDRRRERNGGIFDIPLGAFALSLGLAALIGAAGGNIYAGIVGPRRDR